MKLLKNLMLIMSIMLFININSTPKSELFQAIAAGQVYEVAELLETVNLSDQEKKSYEAFSGEVLAIKKEKITKPTPLRPDIGYKLVSIIFGVPAVIFSLKYAWLILDGATSNANQNKFITSFGILALSMLYWIRGGLELTNWKNPEQQYIDALTIHEMIINGSNRLSQTLDHICSTPKKVYQT